jgi:hypothetical protein
MNGKKLPLSHQIIRGAIGKKFVIRHYAHGIVQSKFPDMKEIIATEAQRNCRNNFKIAVSFAKAILQDPSMKRKWEHKLKVKRRLFNAILKYYLHQYHAIPGKNCNQNK